MTPVYDGGGDLLIVAAEFAHGEAMRFMDPSLQRGTKLMMRFSKPTYSPVPHQQQRPLRKRQIQKRRRHRNRQPQPDLLYTQKRCQRPNLIQHQ